MRRNREWMDRLVTIGRVYCWIVGASMSIRASEWCFPSLWLLIGLHNPWYGGRLFAGFLAAILICWRMKGSIKRFMVGFMNGLMERYVQGREGELFLNVWMSGLASSLFSGLLSGILFRSTNELLGGFGWIVGWNWKVLVAYLAGALCCRFWGWFEGITGVWGCQ